MILYYALGGGLGHLTRGRRVLEALGLARDAAFVTASSFARDPRVTAGIPVVDVPPHLERNRDAHHAWLCDIARDAERVILDTFPCGIQGEVYGLDVPMDLVARLLRWDEYRAAVPNPLPHFDTVWRIEDLAPKHEAALRAHSRAVVSLDLMPASTPTMAIENYWVVVHSGPQDEVRELVQYANELRSIAENPPERVIVISRCTVPLPNGFASQDLYPASQLFPAASRIISAAGFNVMLETEPWRAKHHVVPFARKFDDQYSRAARRRTESRA